jgi:hypothetical protein
VKRFVNICDDGRGGFLFGHLWDVERDALEEASFLIPIPIGIAVPVDIHFNAWRLPNDNNNPKDF